MDFCEFEAKTAQLGLISTTKETKKAQGRVGRREYGGRWGGGGWLEGKRRNTKEGSEPARRGEKAAWRR